MNNYADWYWFVGGVTTKVYSSKRNIYVDPATDAAYAAWHQTWTPANVPTEEDIWYYVKDYLPLWLWDDATQTMSQTAAGVYSKNQLKNYNGSVRYTKVDGGMTAAGIPVRTDDRSRGFIQGGKALAVTDSSFTTKWLGSDGNTYPVDAATMISMADTVGDHTNNCYIVFDQNNIAIGNGSVTTTAQIDAAYQGL
jgi:hypothetical protein